MTIHSDELATMLAAIANGTPKSKSPIKLDKERSEKWDQLKAQVDAMPPGSYVDMGKEYSMHDLTNLYKKRPVG